MTDSQAANALLDIRRSRGAIARIASAHGARNVRVFGSAGRGEASATSDLDLLVDMSEGRNLLDLIALSNELEDALGLEVDVVTEGGAVSRRRAGPEHARRAWY